MVLTAHTVFLFVPVRPAVGFYAKPEMPLTVLRHAAVEEAYVRMSAGSGGDATRGSASASVVADGVSDTQLGA